MKLRDGDAATLVRRAREDAGLSQQALAEKAGLQQSNLAAIESGARGASRELLARILRAARMRPSIPLELFAPRLRGLAAGYGLRDVRVFGSTIRGTDDEASDVDLLVTADETVDFLTLAAFRERAEQLLGFPVDTVVDNDDEVVRAIRREAQPL